jgi:DNA-binding CsgD family transcriptional regulator/PAS domain-containing protein
MQPLKASPSPEAVLPLATLAYECALEPSRWPAFLQMFGDVLQSPACSMWAHNFSTQRSDIDNAADGLGLHCGFEASALDSFSAHYCETNVWLSNPLMHQPGTVVHSSALFSDQHLPRTEWYTDWLRPHDFFYSCAAVVEHAHDRSFNLTVLRSRRAGRYSPAELGMVQALMPHLKTAVALHRKLHHTQALAAGGVALLDSLPLGVVLLDAQAGVLHANRQAQTLMQHTQLLHLQARQVHAAHATADQWLQQSIGQCLHTAQAMAGRRAESVSSPLHSGEGRRLQHWNGQQLHVMVAPLPVAAQPYGLPCGAVVLLSDPSRMLTSLTQSLHSYYRLTPAEAKLVQALIQGLSPQEYAQHMDLSIHTVRSQFKTAAAKVGVSRQADLVRVVLMGPAMLRWQEAFG